MNKKSVAVVILFINVVLLVPGLQEIDTFSFRAGRHLSASPSKTALFYFTAGGLCTAYGFLRLWTR